MIIHLMEFFALTCHQRAERSFYIGNYQLPIFARCTGMYIGFLVTIGDLFLFGQPNMNVNIICVAIMLIDWLIQYRKRLMSNNIRRLFTGMLGGYGILGVLINISIIVC